MELICCGTLGRPYGVSGLLAVRWNNPIAPCAVGARIFVEIDGRSISYEVAALEQRGVKQLIGFSTIATPEAAKALAGRSLFLPEEAFQPLAEGEYYSFQLLGLDVFSGEGERLGVIRAVFPTGANDVYEVAPDDPNRESVLIPATADVIVKVDLPGKRIIIRKLPGLFE